MSRSRPRGALFLAAAGLVALLATGCTTTESTSDLWSDCDKAAARSVAENDASARDEARALYARLSARLLPDVRKWHAYFFESGPNAWDDLLTRYPFLGDSPRHVELERRAESGNVAAMVALADDYASGPIRLEPWVKPDPKLAARWLRRAASSKTVHAEWAGRRLGPLLHAVPSAGEPGDEVLVALPGRIDFDVKGLAIASTRAESEKDLIEVGLPSVLPLVPLLDREDTRDVAHVLLVRISGAELPPDGKAWYAGARAGDD